MRSLVGIDTKTNARIRIFVGSRLDPNPFSNFFAPRSEAVGHLSCRAGRNKSGAEHSSLPEVYFPGLPYENSLAIHNTTELILEYHSGDNARVRGPLRERGRESSVGLVGAFLGGLAHTFCPVPNSQY